MVLASDVVSERGVLLVPSGQEITVSLLEKIRNFARSVPVKEPVAGALRSGRRGRRAADAEPSPTCRLGAPEFSRCGS